MGFSTNIYGAQRRILLQWKHSGYLFRAISWLFSLVPWQLQWTLFPHIKHIFMFTKQFQPLKKKKLHKSAHIWFSSSLILSHRGGVCLVLGFWSCCFLFYFEGITLPSFRSACPSSCPTCVSTLITNCLHLFPITSACLNSLCLFLKVK